MGCESPALKEHLPHGGVGGIAVVLRPGHGAVTVLATAAREIIFVLHDVSGTGFMKFREVEADRFEGPARCAVAACHAAPDVLMEIDEGIHAVEIGRASCRERVCQYL